MQTLEELLELARQLPEDERRRLIEELRKSDAPNDRVPEGAYDAMLEIAGTARSDFSDVSSDKGKHLAEVYATKP